MLHEKLSDYIDSFLVEASLRDSNLYNAFYSDDRRTLFIDKKKNKNRIMTWYISIRKEKTEKYAMKIYKEGKFQLLLETVDIDVVINELEGRL